MKKLKFKKIDAFTKGISPGNPAGYVELNDDINLSEQEMQRLAYELKGFVNEVGYLKRSGDTFNLRFYSSECEVAFCGHATIAIMYDQLSLNSELLNQKEVFINVSAGKLSVFNFIGEEDAVYIMAPEAKYLEHSIQVNALAQAMNIDANLIDLSLPIELINGGLKTLLVSVNSLKDCLSISPNEEILKSFCLTNEIDIIHVSTPKTSKNNTAFRTRVFAPKFGYLEDPATGSGNAAFGYKLLKHGLWKEDITIEQGASSENPNYVKLKKTVSGNKVNMMFGGCSTTRIVGEYHLQTQPIPI